MIAFATIVLIIGAVLLAISSPRKEGEFNLGAKDIQANLPEITGPMRLPIFVLGLVLVGVGLWMGITLFVGSSEKDDKKATKIPQVESTQKTELEFSTEAQVANTPTSFDIPKSLPTQTSTFTPKVLPTLIPTPTSVPSPAWTPTSILIATVHIVVGSHFSPESGKVWICTGDFSIRKADNSQIPLYDSEVGTGLVLVTGTQSNFTIDGPINFDNGIDVGDCLPFAPNEKENGVSDRVSAQFSGGCEPGGCSSVNVIELDKDGNVVKNYWEQRPFTTLTNTPVPSDEEIFTVSDAEQTPLGPPPNCDYWLPPQFTLLYDSTGVPKQWDLTRLPSGVIIGDAYRVSIDSVSLGQQVIFVTTTDAGQFLNLTDGAFLVVSPENADGVLRLRQRNS